MHESSNDETLQGQVISWLRNHALTFDLLERDLNFADISDLKRLVGTARIVALGEATHGTRESLILAQAMLRMLVGEMGFNIVAVEAPWAEAALLNDYLQTGQGNPVKLLGNLRFWNWYTHEALGLVEWLRAYNRKANPGAGVSFHGFDMQFPSRVMRNVVAYLQDVDPAFAERATINYDRFRQYADARDSYAAYVNSPPETKARCRAGLQEVYEELRDSYTRLKMLSGPGRLDQTLQCARLVLQAESLFSSTGVRRHNALRDRYMAENVSWLLSHAGQDARMLIYGHNVHVAKAAYIPGMHSMGSHLQRRYNKELLVIGHSFYEGNFVAFGHDTASGPTIGTYQTLPPPEDSYERYLHKAGIPAMFVDLRHLDDSTPVGAELSRSRRFRFIGASYLSPELNNQYAEVSLPAMFDVIAYLEMTTPSSVLTSADPPTIVREST